MSHSSWKIRKASAAVRGSKRKYEYTRSYIINLSNHLANKRQDLKPQITRVIWNKFLTEFILTESYSNFLNGLFFKVREMHATRRMNKRKSLIITSYNEWHRLALELARWYDTPRQLHSAPVSGNPFNIQNVSTRLNNPLFNIIINL